MADLLIAVLDGIAVLLVLFLELYLKLELVEVVCILRLCLDQFRVLSSALDLHGSKLRRITTIGRIPIQASDVVMLLQLLRVHIRILLLFIEQEVIHFLLKLILIITRPNGKLHFIHFKVALRAIRVISNFSQ